MSNLFNLRLINLLKTAFVIFHHGAFGGATKRFTYLFTYLNDKYPGSFYYFINNHLYEQIKEIFGNIDFSNIKKVDFGSDNNYRVKKTELTSTRYYAGSMHDPIEIDNITPFPRKIYWFYKNMIRQKNLFGKIEKLRKTLDIKTFIGVFSGVFPLVFYLKQDPRKCTVIFSDMDSWFSDVHANMQKLWYRKYYSFNYALENSDAVDFLSPFIFEGIRKRGLKINKDKVSISPCSFADYSKCSIGDKSHFEIAFASRLEKDKNPFVFLEAASIINKEFPQVKFHLLGEGTLAFEIEKYIYENELKEYVSFSFHTNPPEVFKNTSVFVSLQTNTNYPSQSVLEAMACGNAIIASNTGDTGLFLNESNGVMINLSTTELVKALRMLIMNNEKTKTLGINANRYVKAEHTIEKFSDYYIDLICKVQNSNIHDLK